MLNFIKNIINLNFLSIGQSVRSPKSDVPFIHKISWWSYQEFLVINSIETGIINSRLNLLNSRSLVSINIKGTIINNKPWRPYISSVHITEKIIKKVNFELSEAEIVLTPIIKVKDDPSYDGNKIEFNLNQELILHSMGWGANNYRIIVNEFESLIEVHQKK